MKTRSSIGMMGVAVLAAMVGCEDSSDEPAADDVAALSGDGVLKCSSLVVERGAIGDGQSASALAVRDQSGTADNWSKYVEFSPNTSAVCTFRLPAGMPASSVTSLALRTDYRGPAKAQMAWQFEIFDARASRWVAAGDNGFAASWRWSPTEIALGADPARFFAGDTLKIRYSTTSNADASQLDELVVVTHTDGTTPPQDGGTANDGGPAPVDGGPSGPIWRPAPETTWQWQLTGTIDTTVNAAAFDIDLYEAPQAKIDELHTKGHKVICYFDTAYEPGRPDSAQLDPYKGNPMEGWPGQYWLDIRQPAVLAVMKNRLTLAKQKACDGIEADDVDARSNDPGFPITSAEQVAFIRALAVDAHSKGMSFGLKNDLDEIPQLLPDMDFAINEQCMQYGECGTLSPFISAGKAVFHTEYGDANLADTVCPKTKPLRFSTLIKKLDLGVWRIACP